jgi:hypothetical protein
MNNNSIFIDDVEKPCLSMTECQLELDKSARNITRLLTNAVSIEQSGGLAQCIFLDKRT